MREVVLTDAEKLQLRSRFVEIGPGPGRVGVTVLIAENKAEELWIDNPRNVAAYIRGLYTIWGREDITSAAL